MQKEHFTVKNEEGLHMRPASVFSKAIEVQSEGDDEEAALKKAQELLENTTTG